MFFKHKKKVHESNVNQDVLHVYQSLIQLCDDGVCDEDALIFKQSGITLFADIEKNDDNMVSITFQLHHTWFIDPIIETVIGVGDDFSIAIDHACQKFYDNILQMVMHTLDDGKDTDEVEGFSNHSTIFHMAKSKMIHLGIKEGNDDSFWELYHDDIISRLGNKKAYWVTCFAYRDKKSAIAEVLINGQLACDLSEKVAKDALEWELLQSKHTEKQFFFFIQDDTTYTPAPVSKQDIINYTKEALRQFDECCDRASYFAIRKYLVNHCNKDAIAYEIFSFIPEIYCKYAYQDVHFNEVLTMVNAQGKTKSFYQSQLLSYSYIEKTVFEHLKHESDQMKMKNVLAYSVNAKTIEAYKQQGMQENMINIDKLCYFVNENYQLY